MTRRLIGAAAAAAAVAAVVPAAAAAEEWQFPRLTLDVPPGAIAYAPTTIAVNGYVNEPGTLIVRVTGSLCPDGPATGSVRYRDLRAIAPLDGMVVGPGAFSLSASWLPGEFGIGPATMSVCAWVVRPDGVSEMVSESIGVPTRRPAATLVVRPSPQADVGVPATVTVSGSVEVARRLDVYDDRGCGETAAKHKVARRITDESGVAVGPGPFSVTLPWTPAGGEQLCAFLSPGSELREADATASADVDWVPPTVSLRAPADGARGVELEPRFTWEAAQRQRTSPIHEDVLQLWIVDGRRRIPTLRMTTRSWRGLTAKGGGKTSDIAKVSGSSITLRSLWPGTYEWTVSRADWRTPPRQRFTVVGKRMRGIAMKRRMHTGISSRYAAVMDFRANAGVRFVDFRLSWRRTGERWQHKDERAFDGRMSASLWTNCRASGGRLQWILAARDSRGTARSRRGSFPNATAAQCARLKAAGR